MKKKLMLAIMILAPFVVITNASALSETDQSLVDYFYANHYYSTLPYCCIQTGSPAMICVDDTTKFLWYNSSRIRYVQGLTYRLYSFSYNNNTWFTNSTGEETIVQYTYNDSNNLRECNFDLKDSSGNVKMTKSFDFNTVITTYTITFNPPRNTTIEVKDSNDNIIQPTSQYVYELESGTYTYSATNSLYQTLNNITFQVSEDATINVEMEEKLQSQPIRSVYTQYYNYISELVSKVFDIENPIFLFFISFIIGFSLIVLLKKLIGGIL